MRIVDKDTFMDLPPGTVFSKYEPCVFGDIAIKGDSFDSDFFYQQISGSIECENCGEFVALLDGALKNGGSVFMDFGTQGRDGMFDDGQLFAVWEDRDVWYLINRLKRSIEKAKE